LLATICVIFACAICMTPQCATAAASEGAAMTGEELNRMEDSVGLEDEQGGRAASGTINVRGERPQPLHRVHSILI
jgi:hypothetical protein